VSAVAFLHKRRIIHRDLKSPNFLVVNDKIKICDFGMATTASVASRTSIVSSSTKSLGAVGTTRWLAPECTAASPVFNEATDVFGMGMVIWEIVTREIPFQNILQDAQVVCLVKYEQLRPHIPPSCPEPIAVLIRKCWSQNPSERPSADEVLGTIWYPYAVQKLEKGLK
jgi:serine/threonine protein kinase